MNAAPPLPSNAFMMLTVAYASPDALKDNMSHEKWLRGLKDQ